MYAKATLFCKVVYGAPCSPAVFLTSASRSEIVIGLADGRGGNTYRGPPLMNSEGQAGEKRRPIDPPARSLRTRAHSCQQLAGNVSKARAGRLCFPFHSKSSPQIDRLSESGNKMWGENPPVILGGLKRAERYVCSCLSGSNYWPGHAFTYPSKD